MTTFERTSLLPATPSSEKASEDTVERFTSYFSHEIQRIAAAQLGRNSRKYRCLLLCCLIDTMSNVIDISNDGSKKKTVQEIDKNKFLLAVQRFGNWADCTRICRPHLEDLLKVTTDSGLDPVRKFVDGLPPWPDQYRSSTAAVEKVDPRFEDIAALWPKKTQDSGNELRSVTYHKSKVHLELLQHHQLLYACRNKLVHEIRMTTPESEESSGHIQPYYHRVNDWNGKFWQIYHPPGFLAEMAENILSGLRIYCLDHKIEPLSRLVSNRDWYERLL